MRLLALLLVASIGTRVGAFMRLSSRRLTPYRRAQASAAHPLLHQGSRPRSTVRLDSSRTEVINDRPNANRAVWRKIGAADVAFPPEFRDPKGVVHFVGGAVVGAFPKSSYGPLVEAIAREGYCVVTTPISFGLFNHNEVATDAAAVFLEAMEGVKAVYGTRILSQVPTFGVGHSLGAKAHVLMGARGLVPKRRANVLVSFNNFSARESVPLLNELKELGASFGTLRGLDIGKQLGELSNLLPLLEGLGLRGSMPQGWESVAKSGLNMALDFIQGAAAASGASNIPLEFTPTPEETWALIEKDYAVERNMVIQFDRDSIDQSPQLSYLLSRRFPGQARTRTSKLPGTHITPNTPEAVVDYAATNTRGNIYETADEWAPSGADASALARVGETWFRESGMQETSRSAALAASRELRALSTCITDFFNEAPEWPVDAAGALPTAQQRTT